MTVFREVAGKVIHNTVNAMIAASTAAVASATTDSSTTAFLFAPLHSARQFFHNPLLAKLLTQIQALKDGADDNATLIQLKALITQCKADTVSAANALRYASGRTEVALDGLIILLQTVYDKLEKLTLLNIPHDKDPLNIFRYYVALYHAEKISPNVVQGVWEQITAYPNLAKQIELAERQELLVLETITPCTWAIHEIDKDLSKKNSPEYQKIRHMLVFLSVDSLQNQNDKICQTFISPIWGDPNDGILTKCLEKAITEIGNPYAKPSDVTDPPHIEQTDAHAAGSETSEPPTSQTATDTSSTTQFTT